MKIGEIKICQNVPGHLTGADEENENNKDNLDKRINLIKCYVFSVLLNQLET